MLEQSMAKFCQERYIEKTNLHVTVPKFKLKVIQLQEDNNYFNTGKKTEKRVISDSCSCICVLEAFCVSSLASAPSSVSVSKLSPEQQRFLVSVRLLVLVS